MARAAAPLDSPPTRRGLLRSGPCVIGFVGTLGVLLALVLGAAIAQLAYTITLVFLAIFISLGLYPVVTRLQRRGLSKGSPSGLLVRMQRPSMKALRISLRPRKRIGTEERSCSW